MRLYTYDIQSRIDALNDAHPWTFNPTHEMFMGTTNALEMYDRHLDLGRDHKEWVLSKDPNVKGYILSKSSIDHIARTKALGVFLEHAREDIRFLPAEVERLSQ